MRSSWADWLKWRHNLLLFLNLRFSLLVRLKWRENSPKVVRVTFDLWSNDDRSTLPKISKLKIHSKICLARIEKKQSAEISTRWAFFKATTKSFSSDNLSSRLSSLMTSLASLQCCNCCWCWERLVRGWRRGTNFWQRLRLDNNGSEHQRHKSQLHRSPHKNVLAASEKMFSRRKKMAKNTPKIFLRLKGIFIS